MAIEVNITGAIEGLNRKYAQIDRAVAVASEEVGSLYVRVMKQQIVGGHPIRTSRDKGSGIEAGKPSNVTGNLRRNIRSSVTKQGFGMYQVTTGSYMIYSRALEFGHPKWQSGVKYPFVAPTGRILKSSNRTRNLYVKTLKRALVSGGVKL